MTAPAKAPPQKSSAQKSWPHDSAPLHVTGRAAYADDLPLPEGALHLAFGTSPVAHGRLNALDLDAVQKAPGVVAVWSASNLQPMPDCSPSIGDEPLLATGTLHYLGQPVFLVAATSHHEARRAARLARFDITELPAILSVDQALDANARFESGPIAWARGDAARAIAAAPRTVSGSFTVGGQEHFYLEGQIAIAHPTDDGLHIIASTQHPSEIQHKIAHAFHLPMAAVRVETRRMGGGFGGKESQGNALAIAAAVVARATGRSAKMRYDRDDDMMITGKRHDITIRYRAGHDDTGRVLGLEVTHLLRCGWAQDLSLPVADRALLHADNCYHLPDIALTSHRLRTNTQSNTAFRGFGGPQGLIGMERVIEHIAHATGLDPIAVRRANYYRSAPTSTAHARPFGAAHSPEHNRPENRRPQTTPYGMEVTDFIAPALTDRLLDSAAYDARRHQMAAFNAHSPIVKKGLGFVPVKFGISFTLSWLNQAGALVHIYHDGSVLLNHGGTEMGQGLNQKVAQVVADVFGLDAGQIRLSATDTTKVPNTSATAASSGSDLNGMAAQEAALVLRARLAAFLADKMGLSAEAVRFAGGMVHAGGESHPFARLAAWAYQARVPLSATGYYATPKINWDRVRGQGRPFYYFAYGVALAEVAVDGLSGEYRILRADILHDTGTSLNPALDIGQVEGAFVQGAGWLTTEELVWNDKGRLLTHAPSTYKIPAMGDRPAAFNVTLWDQPNAEATIGKSKAVGEPPFMLGISVHHALSAAVAAFGPGAGGTFPALAAPATPEQVRRAIARVQGRGFGTGDYGAAHGS